MSATHAAPVTLPTGIAVDDVVMAAQSIATVGDQAASVGASGREAT